MSIKIAEGFAGQRFLTLPAHTVERLEASPLTRQLYVFAIGYFPRAEHHYVHRSDGCDEYILLYCTEGSGSVEVGGRAVRLLQNQFMVVPRGVPHSYRSDANHPWSLYWIHLRGQNAQLMTQGMESPQDIPPSDASRIDERNRLFDEIFQTLDTNVSIEAHEYASAILVHYLATFRHVGIYRSSGPASASVVHGDEAVRKVIHFMNENIEQRLTVADLAECSGLSESYLYRRFVKQVGIAPIDYFNRLKINRACFWLMNTNMSVSQISSRLDFSESQYFARAFKKVMGVSATAYRAANVSGSATPHALSAV